MGQAKQRGTFEQRKELAIERDKQKRKLMAHVQSRKPSPKHTAMMAMLAGAGYLNIKQ